MYEQFIQMSASSRRPLIFDVRRLSAIQSTSISNNKTSAEAYSRKQAIIAAAESRDKSLKAKTRPIKKTPKPNATDAVNKRNETMSPSGNNQIIKDQIKDISLSNEATLQAVHDAKSREIDLANSLGYNPFNAVAMNSDQARNAQTVSSHGNIEAGNDQNTESYVPSTNLDKSIFDDDDMQVFNEAFEESFTLLVTTNGSNASLSQSLVIMRKVILNATTKGQQSDEESSAKFRKLRLSNPKIRSLICEMNGALELLISVGFHLSEDSDTSSEGETFLMYPEGSSGPTWLGKALKRMEQYERNVS